MKLGLALKLTIILGCDYDEAEARAKAEVKAAEKTRLKRRLSYYC
jgi:hypothetical protein